MVLRNKQGFNIKFKSYNPQKAPCDDFTYFEQACVKVHQQV